MKYVLSEIAIAVLIAVAVFAGAYLYKKSVEIDAVQDAVEAGEAYDAAIRDFSERIKDAHTRAERGRDEIATIIDSDTDRDVVRKLVDSVCKASGYCSPAFDDGSVREAGHPGIHD